MPFWPALIAVVLGGLLLLLWRVLAPASRVRLGPRGIFDPASGLGWIPWEEIEGGYPPSAGQGESIRLRLHVTERLARVLRPRRLPGAPLDEHMEVRIDLSGSRLSPVELLQQIVTRQSERTARSPLGKRIPDV